jgi:hypothetical protein
MITYSHLKSVADSVSTVARLLGIGFVSAALAACYIAAFLIDAPDSGYDEEDFEWLDTDRREDAEVVAE